MIKTGAETYGPCVTSTTERVVRQRDRQGHSVFMMLLLQKGNNVVPAEALRRQKNVTWSEKVSSLDIRCGGAVTCRLLSAGHVC